MEELNFEETLHKMSNITIHEENDNKMDVEEMQPPGSVRGEFMTPDEIFSEEEQRKIDRKNFIIRVKTIALDTLGHKPLINPKSLPKREFIKVVNMCQEIIDKMSVEDIHYKFNELVCNDILCEETDITRYPIYSNKIYS